jgi:hypothetical protein
MIMYNAGSQNHTAAVSHASWKWYDTEQSAKMNRTTAL